MNLFIDSVLNLRSFSPHLKVTVHLVLIIRKHYNPCPRSPFSLESVYQICRFVKLLYTITCSTFSGFPLQICLLSFWELVNHEFLSVARKYRPIIVLVIRRRNSKIVITMGIVAVFYFEFNLY